MKTSPENEETHCPEVQKILDGKPSWIVYWGTAIITLVLMIIAGISWKLFFL
jgi:hypothetical protein